MYTGTDTGMMHTQVGADTHTGTDTGSTLSVWSDAKAALDVGKHGQSHTGRQDHSYGTHWGSYSCQVQGWLAQVRKPK